MPVTAPQTLLHTRHDALAALTTPLVPGAGAFAVDTPGIFDDLPTAARISTAGATEIVTVDASLGGSTFAITRSVDGTSAGALTFPVGALVEIVQSAEQWRRLLRAWAEKLAGYVNVREYGATGDGVTDDTAALQAAINSIDPLVGGQLFLPPGVYHLSSPLDLKPNVTLRGVHGGFSSGGFGSKTAGSCLYWVGAANGVLLRALSCYQLTLEGLTLHGGGVAGTTGLLFDVTTGPNAATNGTRIENLNVYECATGLRFGSSSALDYQFDGISLRNFHIRVDTAALQPTARGLIVESGNGLAYSTVEQGAFEGLWVGVDLIETGDLTELRRLRFANLQGTSPVGIRIANGGSVNNLLVACCYATAAAASATNPKFLQLTGAANTFGTIMLLQNRADYPMTVEAQRYVASIGNYGTAACTCSVQYASIVSIEDRLQNGAGWTVSGGAFLTRVDGEAFRPASGASIRGHWHAVATLSFGTIAASSEVQQTVSLPGVTGGETVVVTPDGGLELGLTVAAAYVLGAGQVGVRLANYTAGPIAVSTRSYRVDAWVH